MHPSYVFKLHPSICSPIPDHCAEHRIQMPRYSNPVCGIPYPTPSSPHVLLNCRVPPLSCWLMAAGGAPGTRETPSHSTCSHLDSVGASKGERWEEQPQLQKPLASQEHRLRAPICQLRHGEHSQNPERARSTYGVTADGVFGEKHLPSSRIL